MLTQAAAFRKAETRLFLSSNTQLHKHVNTQLPLTSLCADHRWPAGSWVCVWQVLMADCPLLKLLRRLLLLLLQIWRAQRQPHSGPSEHSSPHWRRSWGSSLGSKWSLRQSLSSSQTRGSDSGCSGAAVSLWPGRQERKWMKPEGSASADPSCSRWGGWPRSCCLTGAGGGSSWWWAGGSVRPKEVRGKNAWRAAEEKKKVRRAQRKVRAVSL